MTLQHRAPEPTGSDWQTWARRLMQYLGQTRVPLVQQTGDESAAEDAQLMWDRENGWPTISYDNEWRQIVMSGGVFHGSVDADATAAAADTAYALTFTDNGSERISRGTPTSRIVFSEAGEYVISFSAQIASTSASTVNFYFWPKKNGTNVENQTMIAALHQNNATTIITRTAILTLAANDYIEAFWAVDDTSGFLDASAATSFSPAAPAATITIARLHE
jgi:hypothetical protein